MASHHDATPGGAVTLGPILVGDLIGHASGASLPGRVARRVQLREVLGVKEAQLLLHRCTHGEACMHEDVAVDALVPREALQQSAVPRGEARAEGRDAVVAAVAVRSAGLPAVPEVVPTLPGAVGIASAAEDAGHEGQETYEVVIAYDGPQRHLAIPPARLCDIGEEVEKLTYLWPVVAVVAQQHHGEVLPPRKLGTPLQRALQNSQVAVRVGDHEEWTWVRAAETVGRGGR
mmetsp:Transcript_104837/g.306179  ORF Transcript_104837/g.306179 Transcript_104837/m.306179 type:complete len:232 (-) Transcript_104837:409-1104(-)